MDPVERRRGPHPAAGHRLPPQPRRGGTDQGNQMIPVFVRQHVTADGNPKMAYDSEGWARKRAKRLGLWVYQCGLCGKWHLSSKEIPPSSSLVRDSVVRGSAVTFQARDHADVIDPVRLSGLRKAAMVTARSRARTRLIQEFPGR